MGKEGAYKFSSLSRRLVCPVSKVNTHYTHAGVRAERERDGGQRIIYASPSTRYAHELVTCSCLKYCR